MYVRWKMEQMGFATYFFILVFSLEDVAGMFIFCVKVVCVSGSGFLHKAGNPVIFFLADEHVEMIWHNAEGEYFH